MGKFDALLEAVGVAKKAIKSYGDDAANVLKEVKSAEQAVELAPKAREQYLKALDQVYGSQVDRAKEMGFGPKTWYHGAKADFDKFEMDKIREALGENIWGEGIYLSDNPKVASSYTSTGIGKSGPVLPLRSRGGKDAINLNLLDEIPERPQYFDKSKNALFYNKNIDATNMVERDPARLRSQFAAFDPRFKDSPLLMAGGLAGASIGQAPRFQNPFEVAKPLLEAYESGKEKVARGIAERLSLNPADKQLTEQMAGAIGTVGDPLNYVPGLGEAQMMLQMGQKSKPELTEDELRLRALQQMTGRP